MNELLFHKEMLEELEDVPVLDLKDGKRKVLILSDLHMGNGGSRDDLVKNEALVKDVLEKWYYPQGYILVLNGDIEELQRFSLPAVRRYWADLYRIFDLFAEDGRLYKIVGNHDMDVLEADQYPYKILTGLRLDMGTRPIYVYHGHQASQMFIKYNHLVRAFLRYVANPLGIKNYSVSKDRRRKFYVEKRIYRFSRTLGIISVIGHTHRPLFESLTKYDFIKFEIERLCREYAAPGADRDSVAAKVASLRKELLKVAKKDKKRSIRSSLYGEELLIPCVFNSGCAIGKKGMTLLEFDAETVQLVYWYEEGRAKKYVRRGDYETQELASLPWRRVTLNADRLDYIDARIGLLA